MAGASSSPPSSIIRTPRAAARRSTISCNGSTRKAEATTRRCGDDATPAFLHRGTHRLAVLEVEIALDQAVDHPDVGGEEDRDGDRDADQDEAKREQDDAA